ncbi:unnamed protein product, partial [Coregonus sp. 'balchen']
AWWVTLGLKREKRKEGARKRNALQDYQRSDSVRLVQLPDSTLQTKSRKLSIVKCARGCSRNKRLPFTCSFLPRRNRKKDLRENYCRNPDNATSGPWCFTTDHNVRHQDCGVPQCSQGLVDNYCRNPDGRQRPWCFTMDAHTPWEYCNITACLTPSGVICQRWDSQYPHNHSYIPQDYHCKDLRENYCRNPDGRDLPWCFTSDPNVRTAFCTNIPRCGIQNTEPQDAAVLTVRLEGSFCRNPDRDTYGPWCYTNSTAIPWDYCSIKPCEPSENTIPQRGQSLNLRLLVFMFSSCTSLEDQDSRRSSSRHYRWKLDGPVTGVEVLSYERSGFLLTDSVSPHDLRGSAPNGSFRQEVSISHVVCGPEGSNLALIRLAQPALPADSVHTIQLPVAGCSISEGTMCSMYGWGETKGTGHEGVLKVVHLPMVSNERCREQHRGNLHITDAKICAGGRRDEGVCERDYGGPLVCQEGESRVIVGVSVHGRGCARANRPGIFINVPFYTQWIHKVFRHYPEPQIN